ncbi:MAG: hypothetical protein GYA45_11755 [Pelolinea sp.]|nr:hypothetical protein [Pelolinea sp.]
MKPQTMALLTSVLALNALAKPAEREVELPDRGREDPKVKRMKKMEAKSRKINRKIAGKKRKFSGKRNKKK